jgi:hypothetical protein
MRAYPDPARTLKNRTKTIRLFCTVSARHTLPESDLIRFWRFPLHDPRWILFTGLQFMPGTLKMKFDPCGDDAAMAERVSETLGSMTFRLHQAQYDNRSKRAYVEFRRTDSDGGDQLVVAVFTFRTKERLSSLGFGRKLCARPDMY